MAEPSTATPTESNTEAASSVPISQTTDIQALLAELTALRQQVAQNVQVTSDAASSSGEVHAPDPKKQKSVTEQESWQQELASLNLNWGDMDPTFVHQLKTSPNARAALLELHTPTNDKNWTEFILENVRII